MKLKSDIIIIGGGPGGYKAAEYAASKGKSVVLFEAANLGGTCLNVGCIPTKTFARTAEAASDILNAESLGLKKSTLDFDIADIVARKNRVVDQLRDGIATLMTAAGVVVIIAKAEFIDAHTVKLIASGQSEAESDEIFTADNIIIAAGSLHKSLNIEGRENMITSDELLSLTTFPQRLCIVGAGVIGMEFASIFSLLGSKVTVVEFMKECIPALDSDIAKRLRKSLEKRGVTFYMQSGVKKVGAEADGSYTVTFERKGKPESISADKVLMAVGRRPNVEGYGLENTGIDYDKTGIHVDPVTFKTSVEGVYAIGDVNARQMLAHAASAQAIRAVNAIIAAENSSSDIECAPADSKAPADGIDFDIVPAAIFTNPEAACVGMSEDACKAESLDFTILRANYRANGRALAMGEPEGLIKVMADKETGKILGCHAYGAHSADIIQEISALMCAGMSAYKLSSIIHIHPTLSEMLQELK